MKKCILFLLIGLSVRSFSTDSNQDLYSSLELPKYGLSSNLEKLRRGINVLSQFTHGVKAIKTPFIEDQDQDSSFLIPEETIELPMRFEKTGNPVMQMKDYLGRVYFFEILSDTEDGGRAQYQDEKGYLWEVIWDKDRLIIHDTHPQHYFRNQVMPKNYLTEPLKSLADMIGTTTTIVKRNGSGGINKLDGSLVHQIERMEYLCNGVQTAVKTLPAEVDKITKSFATGFATLNNRITTLESKIVEIGQSMTILHAFLIQLEDLIAKSKVIVHCDNSQITSSNNSYCDCCLNSGSVSNDSTQIGNTSSSSNNCLCQTKSVFSF